MLDLCPASSSLALVDHSCFITCSAGGRKRLLVNPSSSHATHRCNVQSCYHARNFTRMFQDLCVKYCKQAEKLCVSTATCPVQ
eukprot:5368506-Amphidinium_carterae.2